MNPINALKKLINRLLEGTCADCNGAGCGACNWSGYDPRT